MKHGNPGLNRGRSQHRTLWISTWIIGGHHWSKSCFKGNALSCGFLVDSGLTGHDLAGWEGEFAWSLRTLVNFSLSVMFFPCNGSLLLGDSGHIFAATAKLATANPILSIFGGHTIIQKLSINRSKGHFAGNHSFSPRNRDFHRFPRIFTLKPNEQQGVVTCEGQGLQRCRPGRRRHLKFPENLTKPRT